MTSLELARDLASRLRLGAPIDLFAGPGGWDEGVRALGLTPRGIELDTDACETGRAAGHYRHQGDVAAIDPRAVLAPWGRPSGGIGSPPCPGFSKATANARGRTDALEVIETLERVDDLEGVELALRLLRPRMSDRRTLLALEPLRWALALEPGWLTFEQVPPVLPLWDACAEVLRRRGYTVTTGILSAEQYGVAQARKRAVLVARSPELTDRLGPATLPAPTHSRYYPRTPDRLDEGVLPWRSMADALGWGMTHRPYPTVAVGTGGGGGTDPAALGGSGARRGVLAELEAGRWRGPRPDGVLRLTDAEAGVLQGFRRNYPWQGARGSRFQQVGNAVPPPLGRAIVAHVAGLTELEGEAAA